jgi:hypothetical protein
MRGARSAICSLFVVVVALAGALVALPAAHASTTPSGAEYHTLTFPVQEQNQVSYSDDFGGPRQHPGNDIMGKKLLHELAAADGTITFVRSDASGHSGNMLILTGTDGWKYWYIHINNDTPGTDDGKNPAAWKFAPGLTVGTHVKKGQFIAYMGDSGEAETTDPHLHFELHRPNDTFIDPYTSLRLSQGKSSAGLCRVPTSPPTAQNPAAGPGYWSLNTGGKVLSFGTVKNYGSAPAPGPLNAWVGITPSATNNGYWVTDAIGHVRAYGDAQFYGQPSTLKLKAPVLAIEGTPSGRGYWVLARDGGIFTYGDAKFYGSTGAMKLNQPVISMASTPSGRGYWLVASDGGMFTFGDAHFYGSTGAQRISAPVTSMVETPNGAGYWLLGRDGKLYRFGNAAYKGSEWDLGWCPAPAALAIVRTRTGGGYWTLVDDGRVLWFGDGKYYGSPASTRQLASSLAAAR